MFEYTMDIEVSSEVEYLKLIKNLDPFQNKATMHKPLRRKTGVNSYELEYPNGRVDRVYYPELREDQFRK